MKEKLSLRSIFFSSPPVQSANFCSNDTVLLRFIVTKKMPLPILFCHKRFLFSVVFSLVV